MLEVKYDHEMSIPEIYSGRSWGEVHKKIWKLNIFLDDKLKNVKSKHNFFRPQNESKFEGKCNYFGWQVAVELCGLVFGEVILFV